MNKLWQQLAIATNWPVLVAVVVLAVLGAMTIYVDEPTEGSKQIVFMFIGLIGMSVFQFVDYRKIGRFAMPFYLFSLLLIFYTIAAPGHLPFTKAVKGASNWIRLPGFNIQPAELMKLAFVMVLARYLRFRSNYRTLVGLLPPFALALIPLAFILKQPDLGTALIFIPALFAMLFVAGAKLWHLGAIVLVALTLAPLAWLSGTDLPVMRHLPSLVRPYQRDRVYAMFEEDNEAMKEGDFQRHLAMTAFGSGGLSGKGIGNIPVGDRVPERHNDMIFALIGEQFGFFGAAVVLAAYIVLFTAGVEIAGSTREPFGRLVAVGVVSMLAGQTFLNLMVVLKLMPVTGVTLPFISYGGSSLLASFMSVGLLLNVGQSRAIVMAKDSFEFDG